MNERLLEAKKNAEKFKEYLQSDSKKEVRKFAEELITHKDNIDFVSILEDALTLYDFIAWKKESVPAETQVMPKALVLINTLKIITEKYENSKGRVKRLQEIAMLARTDKVEADKQLKEFDSKPTVTNFEDEISWIADYYKRYEKRFTA